MTIWENYFFISSCALFETFKCFELCVYLLFQTFSITVSFWRHAIYLVMSILELRCVLRWDFDERYLKEFFVTHFLILSRSSLWHLDFFCQFLNMIFHEFPWSPIIFMVDTPKMHDCNMWEKLWHFEKGNRKSSCELLVNIIIIKKMPLINCSFF